MRLVAVLITDALNPLFVISLALFASIGYILTLLMPVTIEIWQAALWVCTLMPLMGLSAGVYARWKQGVYVNSRASRRMILPVIPLLVLAPSVLAVLSSPVLQISHHGDVHSAHIHQLLYGATPIDNVYVPAYPPNFYWLYHAYLAAIARMTSLGPPFVAALVNAAAVFSSLLWIAQTLVMLKLARRRALYLGALVLFVYCALNIAGILNLLTHLGDEKIPYTLRAMLFEGAFSRLQSALGKVLNFTSMGVGIAIFSAAWCACVKIVKHNVDLMSLVLVSACGVAALAVREIAALYIAAALLVGLAVTGGICLIGRPGKAARILAFWHELKSRVSPTMLLLWFAISLVLSIPLLKHSLDIVSGWQNGRPFDFPIGVPGSANIGMIAAAVLLLMPLFILQCVFVWRKRDHEQYFIQISCLIALLLTAALELPDRNQYKGVYFLSMLMAVSALFALRTMQNSDKKRWRQVGWMIQALLLMLVFSQVIYVNRYYIDRARFPRYELQYDGAHVVIDGFGEGHSSASSWIRENTPSDAAVIAPLNSFTHLNVLYERLPYLLQSQSSRLTRRIPGYDKQARKLEVKVFYNQESTIEDYRIVQENMLRHFPGRAMYAIVKDEEVSPAVMRQRGARLVYEHAGDGANVYWLNSNDQG